MKRTLIFIGVLLSTGCALQPQKTPLSISPDQAQAIGDSLAQYASALYPPARTQLHVSAAGARNVTQVIADALSHRGFGVTDGEGALGVSFDYSVQPIEGGAFVQVTTPGRMATCVVTAAACTWAVRNTL